MGTGDGRHPSLRSVGYYLSIPRFVHLGVFCAYPTLLPDFQFEFDEPLDGLRIERDRYGSS